MRAGWETKAALVVIAIALVPRVYLGQALHLNPDEAMHVIGGRVLNFTAFHHPPLVLWWAALAARIGDAELFYRLMPIVAGSLLPVMVALWVREFAAPAIAWSIAFWVALAPNLVMLTVQLRGYPMAMLAGVAAIYFADRAWAEKRLVWLGCHFGALLTAILAEFVTACLALALGLYGLIHLMRLQRSNRADAVRWFGWWAAGQLVCLAVYAALYFFVVRPLAEDVFIVSSVRTGYLRSGFYDGGNPLWFVAQGALKQVVYLMSSMAGGIAAAALAAIGVLVWIRTDAARAVLAVAPYIAAVGGLAGFYPFARTRHTVLIGLVTLGAIAMAIEWMRLRWPRGAWVVFPAVMAVALATTEVDQQNIPVRYGRLEPWRAAIARLEASVPPGSLIVADQESFLSLQIRWPGEDFLVLRSIEKARQLHGYRFVTVGWDWGRYAGRPEELAQRIDRLRMTNGAREVWLLDMGFDVDYLERWSKGGRAEPVVIEKGILFLARRPLVPIP